MNKGWPKVNLPIHFLLLLYSKNVQNCVIIDAIKGIKYHKWTCGNYIVKNK